MIGGHDKHFQLPTLRITITFQNIHPVTTFAVNFLKTLLLFLFLAAFCDKPTIVDGLVLLTPDLQKYPNGTSVFFSCPPGHDLFGDLSVLCEYGIWNISKEPSCQGNSQQGGRVLFKADFASVRNLEKDIGIASLIRFTLSPF